MSTTNYDPPGAIRAGKHKGERQGEGVWELG